MDKKEPVVACCPRCGKIQYSFDGEYCSICGFRPMALTDVSASDYDLMLQKAVIENEYSAFDTLQRDLREKYCRSTPHYSAIDSTLRVAKEQAAHAHDKECRLAYRQAALQEFAAIVAAQRAREAQQVHTPRCPTCGSPRIVEEPHYLGWGNRTTFRCCNCNYKW